VTVVVQEEESRAREKVRELDSSCRSMIPYAIEVWIWYVWKSSLRIRLFERQHHHQIELGPIAKLQGGAGFPIYHNVITS
jgi:hypothetical protein